MILEQIPVSGTRNEAEEGDRRIEQEPLVMWQVGKIKDMNREFDVAFWQAQDATARLRAGWELVEFYHKLKGTTNELRLHRTVEALQRKQR